MVGQEFVHGQPVIAQHPDGSSIKGLWQTDRIYVAGMSAFIIAGLEREGYKLVSARGAELHLSSQLQALPEGSVVFGNHDSAVKEHGKWWVTGRGYAVVTADVWMYLLEPVTVLHVPEARS